MNEYIKRAFLKGELVLFLGAGASVSSTNSKGNLPSSYRLGEILCNDMGIAYNDDALGQVYTAYKDMLGETKLQEILETQFKFCNYSQEYSRLTYLPLKRIYTLNIDDCLENAFRHNKYKVDVKSRNDKVTEYSYENDITTLIKLNGDINRPDVGYIFSPEQYANNIFQSNKWYNELAQDMFSKVFVFIGTELNEPLLEYHIQKFKSDSNLSNSIKGFVITPKATPVKQLALKNSNLEHIAGTLKDFVDYFFSEFDNKIPTHIDILKAKKPNIIQSGKQINIISKIKYIDSDFISNESKKTETDGLNSIKDFYRGFKPSWNDVILNVPVTLAKTRNFIENLLSDENSFRGLHIILGNAGSGKSTALKQVAVALSVQTNMNVYFLNNDYDDLNEIIDFLESINSSQYLICIDRILNNRYREISELIKSYENRASFIITENTTLWHQKAQSILESETKSIFDISDLSSEDIDKILDHLKLYASWTRLERLTESERREELWKKANRQLLIGLLEVTSGIGYNEIIRRDFNSIQSSDERNLLLLASIPALENFVAYEETLQRALLILNPELKENVEKIASRMNGILHYKDGKITTRHRVYSSRIFENNNLGENYKIIKSYISSFCVYQFPIVINVSKNEAAIYKQIVNFKFLKKFFNDDSTYVLKIYKDFEKELEHEGLFLMQYGIALRTYHKPFESYETLIRAKDAYPESPHIEHALAQQKLILSYIPDDHTWNRDILFDEAKITLSNLSNAKKGFFKDDRYPIATLSRGHINFLVYKNDLEAAKRQAMSYYNDFRKFSEYQSDPYLQDISKELFSFAITGKWQKDIKNWDF